MEHKRAEEHHYLRTQKKFPTVWCPGCGIGIVLGGIIRAVADLRLDKDKVAMVSGIGCTGRMPVYVDFYGMHTTHGRALAYATGLKLARPELTVLVVMGDGDALAIGGNHFIHAARRNLDLTAIVVNNCVYGMTGGQYSPATPTSAIATTAPYGHIEQPFDIANLAVAAGASLVARTTVYHALEMERLIGRAIQKKGFSVVEILSNCHIHYGKMNRMSTAVEMLRWFRDKTVPIASLQKEQGAGKIGRGMLVDRELPEYYEAYQKLVQVAQKGA
ncbi:MAG: 2-oxoacid:ferredoxin oxidoreductase subunit beta [Chloroflexi bacterium]|nr:2-oxoacid:ferredoxin oxidoreductase subunit beta [Chloroflexota bacterium]